MVDKAKNYYYQVAVNTEIRAPRMIACAFYASLKWGKPRTLDECEQAFMRKVTTENVRKDKLLQALREVRGIMGDDKIPALKTLELEPDYGYTARLLNSYETPTFLCDLTVRHLVPAVVGKRRIVLGSKFSEVPFPEASAAVMADGGGGSGVSGMITPGGGGSFGGGGIIFPEMVACAAVRALVRSLEGLGQNIFSEIEELNSDEKYAAKLGIHDRQAIAQLVVLAGQAVEAGRSLSFVRTCDKCGEAMRWDLSSTLASRSFGGDILACANPLCEVVLERKVLHDSEKLEIPRWTFTDLSDYADELGVPFERLRATMVRLKGMCLDCSRNLDLAEEKDAAGDEYWTWRCTNVARCDTAIYSQLRRFGVEPHVYHERTPDEIHDLAVKTGATEERVVEVLDRARPAEDPRYRELLEAKRRKRLEAEEMERLEKRRKMEESEEIAKVFGYSTDDGFM